MALREAAKAKREERRRRRENEEENQCWAGARENLGTWRNGGAAWRRGENESANAAAKPAK